MALEPTSPTRQKTEARTVGMSNSQLLQKALAAHQAGNPKGALKLYRKFLKGSPRHAEALNFAAAAAFQADEIKLAARYLETLVNIAPGQAEVHGNLGNALRKLGRLEDALAAYRRALEIDPDNAYTHYNLGGLLKEFDDLDAAAAAFRRSLELMPDDGEAMLSLGNVLLKQNKLNEAEEALRQGLDRIPEDATAWCNLGDVQHELDRLDQALECYAKCLEINPAHAEALNNSGFVLFYLGRLDESIAAFKNALTVRPDYGRAYYGLNSITGYRATDEELQAMEDLFRAGSDDLDMLFALVKVREDRGEFDRAFEALERGNRLKRMTIDYDVANDEKRGDGIARAFDAEHLAAMAATGNASEAPIFILGMPRSGTTLIEQILASHSQVHGAGELPDFHNLALKIDRQTAADGGFPDAMAMWPYDGLASFAETYLTRVRALAPDRARFTDKHPINFLYIGLIHGAFPNARIVHCRRDPIDTCLSCYRVLFKLGLDFTYDLEELGRFFRAYERLMVHWHAVLPGQILDVCYEDMIADQEGQTRRLLEFCGLDWEDACLAFHETDRAVLTASASQVRQPIYSQSVERWKRYERHLSPLLEALSGK